MSLSVMRCEHVSMQLIWTVFSYACGCCCVVTYYPFPI